VGFRKTSLRMPSFKDAFSNADCGSQGRSQGRSQNARTRNSTGRGSAVSGRPQRWHRHHWRHRGRRCWQDWRRPTTAPPLPEYSGAVCMPCRRATGLIARCCKADGMHAITVMLLKTVADSRQIAWGSHHGRRLGLLRQWPRARPPPPLGNSAVLGRLTKTTCDTPVCRLWVPSQRGQPSCFLKKTAFS
jgi:hypothetical protein